MTQVTSSTHSEQELFAQFLKIKIPSVAGDLTHADHLEPWTDFVEFENLKLAEKLSLEDKPSHWLELIEDDIRGFGLQISEFCAAFEAFKSQHNYDGTDDERRYSMPVGLEAG